MAQTGYTPILIYASGTASNVPLAANLTSSASGAELALNYADGRLYYKNSSGVVTLLASAAGASGDVVGPASATDNALARFDTTTGKLIQNSVGILSDAGVLTGLTGLTSSGNITLSALTSTRVPYASTGGLLVDSANMTFNGTRLTVADLADSGLTSGRVVYASTGGALVDSANLTFDGTTLTANALTVTNATTLNAGTANGVAYLNGSKVLTTGSALVFDGTNLGVGGAALSLPAGYVVSQVSGTSGAGLFRATSTSVDVRFQADQIGAVGLINVASNHPLAFNVNATEQMRLTSTGLGIGTSSPNYKQTINAAAYSYTQWVNSNSGTGASDGFRVGLEAGDYANIEVFESWPIAFRIAGSERMRLDSSGNLGLGVTPGTDWNANFRVITGGTVGASALIFGQSGAPRTELSYNYYRTNTPASLRLITDGASSYLQTGGQHQWFTAPSGTAGSAISFTQAMTLDASGNLLVGRTSGFAFATVRLAVEHGQADYVQALGNSHPTVPYGIVMRYTAASPNNTGSAYIYADDSGGTQRFSVRSNGGVYNFSGNNSNLSDRREKTNFAPAKSYLETICAIPVQTFNYIDQNHEEDPGLTLGVVAQDVQAVAPELVMESNWGTAEEPKMRLSIYQTDLQYALMKCIQEQQALIQTLTARVAALESN